MLVISTIPMLSRGQLVVIAPLVAHVTMLHTSNVDMLLMLLVCQYRHTGTYDITNSDEGRKRYGI